LSLFDFLVVFMMKRQGQSRQVHATGVDARQTVLF
jgi:hypothetical protein